MKKQWIAFSVALLGCSALLYLLFPKLHREKHIQLSHLCIKDPYFEPVIITESSARIPCIEVKIAGKTTLAKLDLGFSGDITLPSAFLKALDKKSFIRCTSYYGIRGKKYQSDIYEIPKINIGGMALFRAKAEEVNPEFENDTDLLDNEQESPVCDSGRIGWELFFNFNVFLDCEHSMMAFCDSLDTLKNQGYPVDAFIETPLLLDRDLIEFEVMTEAGPLRCILDTGSTLNLLNKNLDGGSNDHMILNPNNIDQHVVLNPENTDQMVFDLEDSYEMPVFKIGTRDFGSATFQKIKMPYEVDAVVGMEFLHSKLIFIDFPNRKIYFHGK